MIYPIKIVGPNQILFDTDIYISMIGSWKPVLTLPDDIDPRAWWGYNFPEHPIK